MAQSDNPADPFKKALAEATKVMADAPDLSVTYSVDPAGVSGDAMNWSEATALVSGASRGIGKAIALELGRRGATVVGTATTATGAEAISDTLATAGIDGADKVVDVRDGEAVAGRRASEDRDDKDRLLCRPSSHLSRFVSLLLLRRILPYLQAELTQYLLD